MRKFMIFTFFILVVFIISSRAQNLKMDKIEFNPGETVEVHFNAPADLPENAWIGIIPSTIPHGSESENDKYDLSYQYLEKKISGTLTFTAPSEPGMYDFRMHDTDSNGKEIASVSFSVGGPSVGSLRLQKLNYKPNEEIKVHFIASKGFSSDAWVGIIPSSISHGSETENDKHDLTYQYLNNKSSGTLTFNAPENPGTYDIRMNDSDSDGKEITYITIYVK